MCILKRFFRQYEKSYTLIARLNHRTNVDLKDIEITLPGWVFKVKKIFYSQNDFEIINEPINRIQTKYIETNQLSAFGNLVHKLDKKYRGKK
jgi:hypothetical protein